jgi:hypothetical protein
MAFSIGFWKDMDELDSMAVEYMMFVFVHFRCTHDVEYVSRRER